MKQPICYVSGRITGLDEEAVRINFDYYCEKASRMFIGDVTIVNPLHIRPLFGIKRWTFYMLKDIYVLSMCTHIYMQPNWTDSRGAVIEYFFAKFIFKLDVIKP